MVAPRLMAPWFRDLRAAEADGKVTRPEVRTKLEPWQEQLQAPGNKSYRDAMMDLFEGKTEPPVRLTKPARGAVSSLLSSVKIGGKFHHSASEVKDVAWRYGSGIVMPGGASVGPSIGMTVTFSYADIKPKTKVKIDEKSRTITVSLEGTAKSAIHPLILTSPKEIDIPVHRPKQLGAEYRIVVVDGNPVSADKGKVLAKGSFINMMPM